MVEVSREDRLSVVDHKERCVAVARLGVILRLHSTAGSFVTHRLLNLLSLLNILGLIPCRIMPFACLTCPFVQGCAMEA
jgi:hypothetical protein